MNPTTPILHVALIEPDIAPNVGTIARLCAATGIRLHLIGRLGFRLTDKALRRAGLDYWQHVDVLQHLTWEDFLQSTQPNNIFAFSARGNELYTSIHFEHNDCLLFGSETQGLPDSLLKGEAAIPSYRIPMPSGKVRCLNVALSVGIVVYEAIRQLGADVSLGTDAP